jgi:hypothetical protein
MERHIYPFSAIVGQEQMRKALIFNAIDPAIGGVLIRGEKGTAKSTAVRGLAAVLPPRVVGTLDLEEALTARRKTFAPELLAAAHRAILYVDEEILLGGTTPISAGLVAAVDLLETERRKNRDLMPLLILITDGMPNISIGEMDQGCVAAHPGRAASGGRPEAFARVR